MSFGLFILCGSLIFCALGITKPLFELLKIKNSLAMLLLLLMAMAGFVMPAAALLLPVIPGVICLSHIKWAKAGMTALLGALASALAALLMIIYGLSPQGGLLCGAAAATLAVVMTKYRRARLFAVTMCIPLATLLATLTESIGNAILATSIIAYYNAMAAALIWGVLLTGALEALKEARHRQRE